MIKWEYDKVRFEEDANGTRRLVYFGKCKTPWLVVSQVCKYADFSSDTTGVSEGDLIDWEGVLAAPKGNGFCRLTLCYRDPVWASGKYYIDNPVIWHDGGWADPEQVKKDLLLEGNLMAIRLLTANGEFTASDYWDFRAWGTLPGERERRRGGRRHTEEEAETVKPQE